jgi:hypothetical protein
MDISRTIKDVILITPWLLSLFLFSIVIVITNLLLLFTGNLIFIYEEIKGKIYGR